MNWKLLEQLGLGLLLTAWLVWGAHMIGEAVTHVETPPPPVMVAEAEEDTAEAPAEASEGAAPAETETAALEPGDLARGKKAFSKCKACHGVDEGGKNKVGPNLWGIVGSPVAAAEGFKYSKAFQEHGGTWTAETLDGFLEAPKEYIPGTKMNFKGLSKPQDRADMIAYLESLSN